VGVISRVQRHDRRRVVGVEHEPAARIERAVREQPHRPAHRELLGRRTVEREPE
jgi:hypothetical protein